MDKYEYKVRADEIKSLIAEGDFAEAVKIADSIDWRRVKSVMMLCTISDLYKINRRYQESKEILLLAYEKHPTGRLIVYSLCELSIKMEEYVQAVEYYKEFVQIAPKDTGRYILQYRLYEAQDVTLEERIAVLEEFKKRDYREKWAYELAYLYHRIGLTTKCVEECDEMFLWFGEGKYVLKALELKSLHTPLNADQQAKYDSWILDRDAEAMEDRNEEATDFIDGAMDGQAEDDAQYGEGFSEEEEGAAEEDVISLPTTELPEVKTVDVGQYNTLNLQMALAESMKEILSDEETEAAEESEMPISEEQGMKKPLNPEEALSMAEKMIAPLLQETLDMAKTAQNTDELQEIGGFISQAMAAPQAGAYQPEQPAGASQTGMYQYGQPVDAAQTGMYQPGQPAGAQQTGMYQPGQPADAAQTGMYQPGQSVGTLQPGAYQPGQSADASQTGMYQYNQPADMQSESAGQIRYDDVLSQEYDGQFRLVVPDEKAVEKQITGQLSIEDIMAEWEEMKRNNEQKRMEDVRKRIMEHTGSLFADFDEATKSGLLAQLEKVFVEAIMKDSGKPAIKKVILPEDADEELNQAARLPKAKTKAAPKPKEEFEAESESELESGEGFEQEEELEQEPDTESALEAEEEQEPDTESEAEEGQESELEAEEGQESEPEAEEEPKAQAVPKKKKKPVTTAKKAAAPVKIQKVPMKSSAGKELADLAELEELKEISKEEPATQEEPKAERRTQPNAPHTARELTDEEMELFGQFIHHKRTKEQLVHTLDNMSMAAYIGNVALTGEEGSGTLSLAKGLIREMQYNDSNFSGKVAKVSGAILNKKNVAETLSRISNGALIIEKAADMNEETVIKLGRALERDNIGLLLILEDTKLRVNKLLSDNEVLDNCFNLRVDIEPLDDEALVAYAKQYAEEKEYSIDEFGVLALHTRIADMQTSDHAVSMAEVRELVDEAIYYANKKTPKHFVDILLAKRYDDEDMIILRENDFMHY